jgi:hypothetical protein
MISPPDSHPGAPESAAIQARLAELEALIRAELSALEQTTKVAHCPPVDLPAAVLAAATALSDPGPWLVGQRLTLAARDLLAFRGTMGAAGTATDPIAWLAANGLPPPTQPELLATLAPLMSGLARSHPGWEPAPGPNPIDPRRLTATLEAVLQGQSGDVVNAAIRHAELYLRMRRWQRERRIAIHDEAGRRFLAGLDPALLTPSARVTPSVLSTLHSRWIRCQAAVCRQAPPADTHTAAGSTRLKSGSVRQVVPNSPPKTPPVADLTGVDETKLTAGHSTSGQAPFWQRLTAVLEGLGDTGAMAPDPAPHATCRPHHGTALRHYRAECPRPDATPLLIVAGWLHRGDLLDLGPNRSLIRALTGRGMDVWLLDWNATSPVPIDRSMAHCLNTVLIPAIDYIAESGTDRPVGLVGVGEAGLLALVLAARRPARIAGVVIESGGAGAGTAWPSLVELSRETDFAILLPRLPGWVSGLLEHGLLGIGEEMIPAMERLMMPEPPETASLVCSIRWALDRPDLPTRLLKEYGEVVREPGGWLAWDTGIGTPDASHGVPVLDLVGIRSGGPAWRPDAGPLANALGLGGYDTRAAAGPQTAAFMSTADLSSLAESIDLWFSTPGGGA